MKRSGRESSVAVKDSMGLGARDPGMPTSEVKGTRGQLRNRMRIISRKVRSILRVPGFKGSRENLFKAGGVDI